MYGPTKNPAIPPTKMQASGVTIISSLVLPETKRPISTAIYAAINAPSGSPGDPAAKFILDASGNAPIIPATAAETVVRGVDFSFAATPTPMPAPVIAFATFPIWRR